jgi:hypothetical protein
MIFCWHCCTISMIHFLKRLMIMQRIENHVLMLCYKVDIETFLMPHCKHGYPSFCIFDQSSFHNNNKNISCHLTFSVMIKKILPSTFFSTKASQTSTNTSAVTGFFSLTTSIMWRISGAQAYRLDCKIV